MIIIHTLTALFAMMMQIFFTSTEMAFTTVSRPRLKELADSGNKNAILLSNFLAREGMFLGTALVGTNLSVVISSVLVTRIFAEYVGPGIAPLLNTVFMVPITLIVAEIVPKIIAREFSMQIALGAIIPLKTFFVIFKPIILSVTFIAKILTKPFRERQIPWEETFTKSDLKTLLLAGHESGEVEKSELNLIHKVLDFGEKNVKTRMIPLYRVSSIAVTSTLDDLKSLVSMTGFSRIPVYKDSKNNILGIINIYDVLYQNTRTKNQPIEEYIRETVYVKEKDGLDIALARLRHKKQPMGITLDDMDKITGIITIEDILEELVGNIEDRR